MFLFCLPLDQDQLPLHLYANKKPEQEGKWCWEIAWSLCPYIRTCNILYKRVVTSHSFFLFYNFMKEEKGMYVLPPHTTAPVLLSNPSLRNTTIYVASLFHDRRHTRCSCSLIWRWRSTLLVVFQIQFLVNCNKSPDVLFKIVSVTISVYKTNHVTRLLYFTREEMSFWYLGKSLFFPLISTVHYTI